MAGKSQHTIPRFMLKGFASGEGRNDPNVWFYGRGIPGRERTIANISVENYFYGTPEESDLDQRITLLEEDFANLVDELRLHTSAFGWRTLSRILRASSCINWIRRECTHAGNGHRQAEGLADLVRLIAELETRHIHFESLTEKIETRSPAGKLVFHVFAALAEFERNLIRERTVAGLKAARARGRKGGRPATLSAKEIKTIQALLKTADIPVAEIAARFGVARVYPVPHRPQPCRMTIHR
jgi:hypothetical protein